MKYERIWKKKISFFRSNTEFIKLFLGQTISAFGDWFNLIAVAANFYPHASVTEKSKMR